MDNVTTKTKYILAIIMTTIIGVFFIFFIFGDNYDMGEDGFYDKQIEISLSPNTGNFYSGSFISTKTSDRFHAMIYFSFTAEYTEKNADEDNIYKKIAALVNSAQFYIKDENGVHVDLYRMSNSSSVVVDNGIAIAIAESIKLKSGKKYFIEIKMKNGIDKYHFLSPVMYVFRKPPPSL